MNVFKKYGSWCVRLLLAAAVAAFVGWRIYGMVTNPAFQWPVLAENAGIYFALAFLLMPLNWFFEAEKWRLLLKGQQVLSRPVAFKATMAGISTAMVTPNRLGTFLGRVAFLNPSQRFAGTMYTALASLAQFTVTLAVGVLALLFLFPGPEQVIFIGFYGLVIGLLVLGVYVYFHPKLVLRPTFVNWFGDKFQQSVEAVNQTSLALKSRVLGISCLRYGTYCLQFLLILWVFDHELGGVEATAGVMVTWLLMTLIPGLFFGKLFVREAAALVVFGRLGLADELIILSGFLLWLVNMGLPALIGTVFLVKRK